MQRVDLQGMAGQGDARRRQKEGVQVRAVDGKAADCASDEVASSVVPVVSRTGQSGSDWFYADNRPRIVSLKRDRSSGTRWLGPGSVAGSDKQIFGGN